MSNILVKKTTLSSAQILLLDSSVAPVAGTNRILILPKAAAGKINNVLMVSLNFKWNTISYTSRALFCTNLTNLFTVASGINPFSMPSNFLSQVQNNYGAMNRGSTSPISWDDDLYITLQLATANGDSPIDVYTCYEERDLV